jgi:hypothetical protein
VRYSIGETFTSSGVLEEQINVRSGVKDMIGKT